MELPPKPDPIEQVDNQPESAGDDFATVRQKIADLIAGQLEKKLKGEKHDPHFDGIQDVAELSNEELKIFQDLESAKEPADFDKVTKAIKAEQKEFYEAQVEKRVVSSTRMHFVAWLINRLENLRWPAKKNIHREAEGI